MNRQIKIKALDAAFRGNLSNLNKVKEQEHQIKSNCIVIFHNLTYRITSIIPRLSKHEKFLNRELTESEYKAFLTMFLLEPEKINVLAENKIGLGIRVIELPNNFRYLESEVVK